jgi:multiple sugar transport system permease protein
LPPLRFLYSQSQAIPSIAAVDIWKGLGFGMIMYLAGLQGIPSELYDAARVDGANAWGLLRHITLPFLWPVTTLILVMDFRYTIQMFTPIYMLTSGAAGLGGPLNSTRTLMLLIYQKAFAAFQLSYASALSVILALIILIFAAIQTRLGRQTWEL